MDNEVREMLKQVLRNQALDIKSCLGDNLYDGDDLMDAEDRLTETNALLLNIQMREAV